jgi:WD40 repeat protein/serine/threonine protein kinase
MQQCPSAEQLEKFLDDRIDDDMRKALSQHIDSCAACQAVLESITALTSLSSGVGQTFLAADATGRQACFWQQGPMASLPENSATNPDFLAQLKRNRPRREPLTSPSPLGGEGRVRGSDTLRGHNSHQGDTHPSDSRTRSFPIIAGYEILAELGRGGMGVVYKARHIGLDRLVALKMILAGPHAGPREQIRFRQEAEAVARLRHANLIQIYDIGESDGCSYLALEFIEGASLAQVLRGTPQPIFPAARLIEILAGAMHYAHQQGIVHRDLKPGNILLEGRTASRDRAHDDDSLCCLVTRATASLPNPRITDFGLAKRLDNDELAGRRSHQSGDLVGTPSYMAPEQARDNGLTVGPAADVYALGAILYELLTGRPPFRGPTPVDTVLQVLHDDPVQPSSFRSDLPRDLETICLKCLAKDPGRRYESAQALADDLYRFRKGQPITARPIAIHEYVWKWARRRPSSAALICLAVLMAVIAYSTITWLWHDARTARDDMEIQREKAEVARRNEADHRGKARTSLYFSRVAQSQLQWRLNDFHGAEQSLAKCLPGGDEIDDRGWEWHYLQGLMHNDLFTLPNAHSGLGGSVAYDRTGKRIATVISGPQVGETPQPSQVRLWDARTGGLVKIWTGPGSLDRVTFDPNGGKLALASADGVVLMWYAETGEEILRQPMHQGKVWALVFSPDGKSVASAGEDGRVKLWESKTGRIRHDIRAHPQDVHSVSFHPYKPILASGSADTTVKLWDVNTGKEINAFRGHKHAILCVAFSPDGESLVSASGNGNLKIWDVESGRITQSLTSDTGGVLNVVYSPDGRYLAKAGKDGSVRIWHLTTGVERMAFRGHTNPVEWVAFSPDCQRVASISPGDGLAKVWDLTRHPEHATFARTDKDVEAITFVDDGKGLMSITAEGKLQVWDTSTGMLKRERLFALNQCAASPAVLMSLSSAGRYLAARSVDDPRVVRCWNTVTGIEVCAYHGHIYPVCCIHFSQDGRYLATCACESADGQNEIKIWDAVSGKALATKSGKGRLFHVAFTPDSEVLAWSGQIGRSTLWQWKSTSKSFEIVSHQGDVTAISFSPDGKLLSTAGMEDRRVKVWDVASILKGNCKEKHTLAAPTLICDLAFSPDNRRLAAISRDKLRMWDVETGHEALTLHGANQRYWDPPFSPRVAFSPDGTLLAGTNWNESISLWEAPRLDTEDQFANFQEKRRRFADERSSFWHLQEAEVCLNYRNINAARFHMCFLTDDFRTGPLQARKDRMQKSLQSTNSKE